MEKRVNTSRVMEWDTNEWSGLVEGVLSKVEWVKDMRMRVETGEVME